MQYASSGNEGRVYYSMLVAAFRALEGLNLPSPTDVVGKASELANARIWLDPGGYEGCSLPGKLCRIGDLDQIGIDPRGRGAGQSVLARDPPASAGIPGLEDALATSADGYARSRSG